MERESRQTFIKEERDQEGGANSTLTLARATQGHCMPPASAFTAFQYVTAVLRQSGFLFLRY